MYFLLSFSGWGLEGQLGLKFSWYTLNSVYITLEDTWVVWVELLFCWIGKFPLGFV